MVIRMVVKNNKNYVNGYNSITTMDGPMFMDVGIIKLADEVVYVNEENHERVFLLITGKVEVNYCGRQQIIERRSCFDEKPICLHLPSGEKVSFKGKDETEIMYQAVENDQIFDAVLYGQDNIVSDVFGQDVLQNTSIRTVRTIIDDSIAPYSNLVIGEVINHPGKWSSYPPHHHVQPEVYHYRFLPEQGFGVSIIDDQAYKIEHKSTSMIRPSVVHPQCSAPGYALYYVWMIPHKPKRWLKDRTFEEKHTWLLEENPPVWSGEKTVGKDGNN